MISGISEPWGREIKRLPLNVERVIVMVIALGTPLNLPTSLEHYLGWLMFYERRTQMAFP